MAERKVFIIGIDGGSWDVLRPLAEAGLMPRTKELMSRGRWGDLLSTIPYITCPAWLSLASGRNPGWVGAFGFVNLKPGSYELSYYNYHRDPELPELWDMLGHEGFSSGVMNNPVVRYPREITGYMVPGFLADERHYETSPESLRALIEEAADGYEIEPRGFSVMEPDKTVRECSRVMEKRFRAMRSLLKEQPTDFFLGIFHLPDRVCHATLNRTGLPLDAGKDELSGSVSSFFNKLDEYIGTLFDECLGRNDLFVMISDHGFSPCLRGLNLNTWLVREGYLSLKPLSGLSRLGITQRRIAVALDKVGLLKPAMKYTPGFLRRRVPEGIEKGAHISVVDIIQSGGVDWHSTLAIALPNHGIYINTADRPHGSVSPGQERDTLIEEIRRKLMQFQDPITGGRPVTAVNSREELYSGPRLEKAPDLVVETKVGWNTKALIDPRDELVGEVRRADHRREGLYLVIGPGVAAEEAGEARIEDIAPTVLSFMGMRASSMDGESLA